MESRTQFLKVWLPLQGWLVAILTILCAVWLAQLTWLLIGETESIKAPTIRALNQQAVDNSTNWAELSRNIAKREFFGNVVIEQIESDEVTELDAPETKLSLKLLAVMAQDNGSGFAIISERSGGAGSVFSIDDDLFGQARLVNVFPDRVIIDRRGELETLRYEKITSNAILQSVGDETAVAGQTSQSNGSNTVQADTFQSALAQANQQIVNGGDAAAQIQGMMEYVTRRANEDPAGFVQEMGLEPTEGGYSVTRRARQLQMVGLRPGDIVTAVNDQPVGNIQSDQVMLNQIMQTGGELKIQIRRGSRSFTIYQSIPTY